MSTKTYTVGKRNRTWRQFVSLIILSPIVLAIVIWLLIPARAKPFKHESDVVPLGTLGNNITQFSEVGPPERISHDLQVLSDHDWRVNAGAYEGLSPGLLAGDLERLAQVVESSDKLCLLQRDEYWFPVGSDGQVSRSDRWKISSPSGMTDQLDASPVPILLWPSPTMFRESFVGGDLFIPTRDKSGNVDLTTPFQSYVDAGIQVSREINFQGGFLSSRWTSGFWPPESALGPRYARRGVGLNIQTIGWVIDSDPNGSNIENTERSLRRGKPLGGAVLGRKKAVRLNDICVLMQIEQVENEPTRMIGYAFADGIPLRAVQNIKYPLSPSRVTLGGFDHTLRHVGDIDVCSSPWPTPWTIPPPGSDDEITPDHSIVDPVLSPTPLIRTTRRAQSRFVIPETIVQNSTGVITIRKDKTWKPFDESYRIENGFDTENTDDIRAFVLVVSMMSDQDLREFVEAISK